MVNKRQLSVLTAIVAQCKNNTSCLVSYTVLQSMITPKMATDKLQSVLEQLEMQDYIDIIKCDKNGEELLCITPHNKVKRIKEEQRAIIKSVVFKIILAVAGSIVAFLVTRFLTMVL